MSLAVIIDEKKFHAFRIADMEGKSGFIPVPVLKS